MIHVEFAILFLLLVWIIRKLPKPWLVDASLRRIVGQLNRLEAEARHVSLEQIDQEFEEFYSKQAKLKGWF
ncbi:MAG: hypothetical protein LAO30_02235 [Acidobacteriia bacterium]|nr:hypothetical protein [Terriglobia bacterium]